MDYILYSTKVKLRDMELMVPPISVYYLRKLLELKDSGTNLDDPTADDLGKIVDLIGDVIKENHPDLDKVKLEKSIDVQTLREIMDALTGIPKNVIAQTGNQATPDLSQTVEAKIEN